MNNKSIALRMALVVAASVVITVAAVLSLAYLLQVTGGSSQRAAAALSQQTQRSFDLLDSAVKFQGNTQKLVQATDPDVMESLISQNELLVKEASARVNQLAAGDDRLNASFGALALANQQVTGLVMQAHNAESHQAVIENSNPAFERLLGAINEHQKQGSRKLEEEAAGLRTRRARLESTIFALVIIGIISLIVVGLILVRSLSKALRHMIGMVKDLAEGEGDFTTRLEIGARDELGELATWFNTFLDQIHNIVFQVTGTSKLVGKASTELSLTSEHITTNSEQTATQAKLVLKAAQAVSQNLQTIATGAAEMGISIQEIAKNAGEAAKIATSAVTVAATATATVSKLGDSSMEIGKVVKVIKSIAEQTNLLALNATIEAARAGEAGKGFAVAHEVKELANQTSQATHDISAKIATIQTDTQAAINAILSISNVINQVNEISNTIATAVEEQNATTNEMSRNIGEAALGSQAINSNINGVADAAGGTTREASQTQRASRQLVATSLQRHRLVEQFKIKSGGYEDVGPDTVLPLSTAAHA
jgi:methyl-accepting chemotaxis protein